MEDELDVDHHEDMEPSSATYPWPSRCSPRLRFSEAQKAAILSWGKDMGAANVPTIGAVKRCQDKILKLVGDPTEKVVTHSGTTFYINDVGKAIAKDYANPITRSAMCDYPVDGEGGMSQVWNGMKMLFDLPPDMGTPSVRVDKELYFLGELLQLDSEEYFIPTRFFYARSQPESDAAFNLSRELYALGHSVARSDNGFVVAKEQVCTPISSFYRNFEEISQMPAEFECGFAACSSSFREAMPHRLRAKAQGRTVYSVPLIIFMDDVSGNISKQWNKHHVIYMSNANLPREMLEKEFCIQFVSSSPHATPMELMEAMRTSICKAADSGIVAWDCVNHEEVLLDPYGLFFGGDNLMHAEECSHAG
ncbi:hypothetical protein A0H81_05238 [Grifola frondosa]|uniref:Uncharacterized protein n=1 Tax=Grifola frondosa TaxID=5627 RepID=A0A1C7MBW1_GRIFR|nr:hypothetical protein A0H81_05238 [Grifola frondosa]